MNFKSELAFRVCQWLLTKDWQGQSRVPGGACLPQTWTQSTGAVFGIAPRGDAFDLYLGKNPVHNVCLSRQDGVALGKWLVRWWVVHSWCGVKHWIWYRASAALLDGTEKQMRLAAQKKSPA